jgi:hypothetical protein
MLLAHRELTTLTKNHNNESKFSDASELTAINHSPANPSQMLIPA